MLYNSGDNWAVLACGSTGYINYRHQADIFHVYHTLLKNGFSKNGIQTYKCKNCGKRFDDLIRKDESYTLANHTKSEREF